MYILLSLLSGIVLGHIGLHWSTTKLAWWAVWAEGDHWADSGPTVSDLICSLLVAKLVSAIINNQLQPGSSPPVDSFTSIPFCWEQFLSSDNERQQCNESIQYSVLVDLYYIQSGIRTRRAQVLPPGCLKVNILHVVTDHLSALWSIYLPSISEMH